MLIEDAGIYSEYDCQVAVAQMLDLLQDHGFLAWSHPPNEAKHKPQYRVKQAKAGMKAGEPDCLIYLKSKETIFVELKLTKGVLNANQKKRHKILENLGYSVYTVKAGTPRTAVREVAKILMQHGLMEASQWLN